MSRRRVQGFGVVYSASRNESSTSRGFDRCKVPSEGSPLKLASGAKDAGATSRVQSIERALGLLEDLAEAGGSLTLSELGAVSGLPVPTIHRLVRTLMANGYIRQEPHRRYALGPALIRLGEVSGRLLGTWVRPHLDRLMQLTDETANLAMLDGEEVVYIAQVPSHHAMRMFTEPGRRAHPHSTAVGKVLLAQLPPAEARALVVHAGMPKFTATTITDPDVLLAHLEVIRRQGYAIDDGEQEIGVRCFAVPLNAFSGSRAISVSGPTARLLDDAAQRVVPMLHQVAQEIDERIASVRVAPSCLTGGPA